ncbi:MAG: L-threonylcarbamoyladenylate synthase, partial [Planctomycetota bacterium]
MRTEILKIGTLDRTRGVHRAARWLDQGKLVAFPTETVYGIGCKAEKHTFERLNKVKGRQPDKRYTLHIGSPEQLTKYIP